MYFQIVDLPIDHPSCSKQHAVLQYRLVQYQKETGGVGRKVKYVSWVYDLFVRVCVRACVCMCMCDQVCGLHLPRFRPYIIDLESTNGTYVNNQRIETAKYMELKEKVRLHTGRGGRTFNYNEACL